MARLRGWQGGAEPDSFLHPCSMSTSAPWLNSGRARYVCEGVFHGGDQLPPICLISGQRDIVHGGQRDGLKRRRWTSSSKAVPWAAKPHCCWYEGRAGRGHVDRQKTPPHELLRSAFILPGREHDAAVKLAKCWKQFSPPRPPTGSPGRELGISPLRLRSSPNIIKARPRIAADHHPDCDDRLANSLSARACAFRNRRRVADQSASLQLKIRLWSAERLSDHSSHTYLRYGLASSRTRCRPAVVMIAFSV